jgi:pimeloyl-ACP methyl ester carboxylesterase
VHVALTAVCVLAAAWVAAELPADTEEITGEWQGALYAIYVPAAWNGDLVLYAHRWVNPLLPVHLPTEIEPFRDALLDNGFAVAYSSFSKTGNAVKQGFKETEHLLPLFMSSFGQPDHVYAVGHSMGGLISVMMAEKNPGKVDGALSICGVVGGQIMTADYIGDLRVLFDSYYSELLPGSLFEIPDGIDIQSEVIIPAFVAVLTDPDSAIEMSFVEQLGMVWQYPDPFELADTIVWGLAFQYMATDDAVEVCGGYWFDNTELYTHPNPPVVTPPILNEPTLNAIVARYTPDPACVRFMTNWYEPTGKLRVPVLTLHETRDPIAPIKHEWEYAARVAAQGSSQWLVQRTKDAWGHCDSFTNDDMVTAFAELVLWVEQGVQPAP